MTQKHRSVLSHLLLVLLQQAEATYMALLLLLVQVNTSNLVTLSSLSVNHLSGSAVAIQPDQQHGVCCVPWTVCVVLYPETPWERAPHRRREGQCKPH
jgi:hypothetical protein